MHVPVSVFYLLVSGVAHGLVLRWAMAMYPSVRRRRRIAYGATAALAVFPAMVRAFGWYTDAPISRALAGFSQVELLCVLMMLLPLGALALGFRVHARFAAKATKNVLVQTPAPDAISRRQAIERAAGTALFGVTASAVGWGAVRGRHHFDIQEVVVKIPRLPRALDGYVIAQVSDIHVGAFVGEAELEHGFSLVRGIRPDLVVATGDLVDFSTEAAPLLASRLAALRARDGVYAILGNHDHFAGAEGVAAELALAGVRLLSNEHVRVREGDGGGFVLAGVDDLLGRKRPQAAFCGPDLGRALAGAPPDRATILLAHQPVFFREAAGRIDLQLSGHTHGGQINPGFTPARLVMEFVHGRYERQGSTLWVNRGFGTAGPPARIGAPPEITKIVLVSG